jgi:probable phosphoglycerate mutase
MDTMLNEKGLLQAKQVAERLAKEDISAVYTSSLTRAKATALEITKRLNVLPQELHDCREICLGPWQGLTIDEIKESYSEHFRIYREKPSEFNMPGAETFLQVAERFCSAINTAMAENPDKNIVIVSHGTAIKAAIICILGMDIDYYNKFRIDNASISMLQFNERYQGGVAVKCLNDTCHLQGI